MKDVDQYARRKAIFEPVNGQIKENDRLHRVGVNGCEMRWR